MHTDLRLLSSALLASLVAVGCSKGDDVGASTDDVRSNAGASEGETCGNGVFGTPSIACASGLECIFPEAGTAPSGPPGSSSASTGRCERRAKQGEMCANGVFGTPTVLCATGLECRFPGGTTAPSGPPGSSSASTGTCESPAAAGY